jgi:TonB family protein
LITGDNAQLQNSQDCESDVALCNWTLSFSCARLNGQTPPPGSSEQTAKSLVDVPQDVLQGLMIHKIEPEYPPESPAMHNEGPVVVAVVVGQDGSVLAAEAKCGGSPPTREAAVRSVKQWQYRKPVFHDRPVAVRSVVIVDFIDPANAARSAVLRVDTLTAASHLQSSPAPDYPELARTARIQGCVVVRAQIDESGNVKKAEFYSGHPMLGPPAQKAVQRWRYKPFLRDGAAVSADAFVVVNFVP